MRSILAATAVCFSPLTALASPIYDYDFLTVDYEGTINFVQPWGSLGFDGRDPKIGDRVSGSLSVNLHNVPRDNFPGDPARGEYSGSLAEPSYTSPSFVRGYAEPGDLPSIDRLQVQDNIFGGRDLFDVVDQEQRSATGPFTGGLVDGAALALIVSSTTFDFIHGDGPLQSFEVTADQLDPDQPNFGERVNTRRAPSGQDWFGGIVRFAIGKLTVTPGRCSAP